MSTTSFHCSTPPLPAECPTIEPGQIQVAERTTLRHRKDHLRENMSNRDVDGVRNPQHLALHEPHVTPARAVRPRLRRHQSLPWSVDLAKTLSALEIEGGFHPGPRSQAAGPLAKNAHTFFKIGVKKEARRFTFGDFRAPHESGTTSKLIALSRARAAESSLTVSRSRRILCDRKFSWRRTFLRTRRCFHAAREYIANSESLENRRENFNIDACGNSSGRAKELLFPLRPKGHRPDPELKMQIRPETAPRPPSHENKSWDNLARELKS